MPQSLPTAKKKLSASKRSRVKNALDSPRASATLRSVIDIRVRLFFRVTTHSITERRYKVIKLQRTARDASDYVVGFVLIKFRTDTVDP